MFNENNFKIIYQSLSKVLFVSVPFEHSSINLKKLRKLSRYWLFIKSYLLRRLAFIFACFLSKCSRTAYTSAFVTTSNLWKTFGICFLLNNNILNYHFLLSASYTCHHSSKKKLLHMNIVFDKCWNS